MEMQKVFGDVYHLIQSLVLWRKVYANRIVFFPLQMYI